MLERAARQIGARVILNNDYGLAGQIRFKNGVTRFFRRHHFDINPLGASEIGRYKCYTNDFLRKFGYPAIEGMTFFSDEFARELGSKRDIHAAYRYARSLGFPVIVKPNSKGQGEAVAKVYNRRDFYVGMREVFKRDSAGLVERVVIGNDYRVTVLDDRIISALERRPLELVGDGTSTIRQLLEARRHYCRKLQRGMRLDLNDYHYRLLINLRRQKLSFDSVPGKGQTTRLLDNANLSTGGDSRDVMDETHPGFRRIALDITRKMGLRLCGVDIMVEGDISEAPRTYWVIEINVAPALDTYSFTGRESGHTTRQKLLFELPNSFLRRI